MSKHSYSILAISIALAVFLLSDNAQSAAAPDKLIGIHSARVMSQSFPWVAQEAGLFKKYNLDFNLVFISSSNIVTAALLGGDAEMTVTGGIGNVAAYVKGSTDVVFTGGVKNVMTQTLVSSGNIKKPEDLKGKRIGVSRIGGNSHYFTIQALRRHGMEPNRDYSFLQTGGDPETLAALLSGSLEVANLTPTTDDKRLTKVLDGASGFLYYVSVAGVTGANAAAAQAIESAVSRLKRATTLPVAVGFGVREPQAAAAIAKHSDAVVVGSAFVDEIAGGDRAGAVERVLHKVAQLSEAVASARA